MNTVDLPIFGYLILREPENNTEWQGHPYANPKEFLEHHQTVYLVGWDEFTLDVITEQPLVKDIFYTRFNCVVVVEPCLRESFPVSQNWLIDRSGNAQHQNLDKEDAPVIVNPREQVVQRDLSGNGHHLINENLLE